MGDLCKVARENRALSFRECRKGQTQEPIGSTMCIGSGPGGLSGYSSSSGNTSIWSSTR